MSDGVGRALAVIGSLASCPPSDFDDAVDAGDGYLLALDIADGDDDGDGSSVGDSANKEKGRGSYKCGRVSKCLDACVCSNLFFTFWQGDSH